MDRETMQAIAAVNAVIRAVGDRSRYWRDLGKRLVPRLPVDEQKLVFRAHFRLQGIGGVGEGLAWELLIKIAMCLAAVRNAKRETAARREKDDLLQWMVGNVAWRDDERVQKSTVL